MYKIRPSHLDFLCGKDRNPQREWKKQRKTPRQQWQQSMTTSELEEEINTLAQQAKVWGPRHGGSLNSPPRRSGYASTTSPNSAIPRSTISESLNAAYSLSRSLTNSTYSSQPRSSPTKVGSNESSISGGGNFKLGNFSWDSTSAILPTDVIRPIPVVARPTTSESPNAAYSRSRSLTYSTYSSQPRSSPTTVGSNESSISGGGNFKLGNFSWDSTSAIFPTDVIRPIPVYAIPTPVVTRPTTSESPNAAYSRSRSLTNSTYSSQPRSSPIKAGSNESSISGGGNFKLGNFSWDSTSAILPTDVNRPTPVYAIQTPVVTRPTTSESPNAAYSRSRSLTNSTYSSQPRSSPTKVGSNESSISGGGNFKLGNFNWDSTSAILPTDVIRPTPVYAIQTPNVTIPTPVVIRPTAVVTRQMPNVTIPTPVVTRPTPVVTIPTPVVTRPTPVVTRQMPNVSRPTPVLTIPTPVVTRPTPVVTRPTPVVTRQMPNVNRQMPNVTIPTPVVTRQMPNVTRPTPVVPRSTPDVTRPLSYVTRPMPKYKGLVMVLDKLHKLKQVESDKQMQGFMTQQPKGAASFKSTRVTRALGHIQKIPVEKIHHFNTTAAYIKYLLDSQQMCDIDLLIGAEIFRAHRAALACYSGYFYNIFYKRDEGQNVPSSIKIKNCSSATFKMFIDFVYTSEIKIYSDILTDLVAIADFLDVPEIKERCSWYLEEMSLEDAIESITGKQLSTSSDIFQFALSLISEQFCSVYESKCFYELDVDMICLILSHDDLHVTSEMDVFRVALKWTTHKMNERKRYVNRVMKCVRYPHMAQDELVECFDVTDILHDSREIKNIILHSTWVITAKVNNRDDPLKCPKVRPRTCFSPLKRRSSVFFSTYSLSEVEAEVIDPTRDKHRPKLKYSKSVRSVEQTEDILAFGGFQQFAKASDNKEVKIVERYYAAQNQWLNDINLQEPRFFHSTALLNDKVYLVGGSDPVKARYMPVATNEAFVLNPDDGTWTPIKPMDTARMHHEVVALYGMLYAIGGEDEDGRVLNTVECYNPMTDKWFYVNPMSTARLGAGVTVFEGKIFVAGGVGESERNSGIPVLSSVEVFDPLSNSWTPDCDLRFPRCHANLVNVKGILCLCGGATQSFTTNNCVLTSVADIDVYNKMEGVWEQKSNLVIARHLAGAAVIGGKVFIMGGSSSVVSKTLSSVECYDAVNNVWINGVKDLPYPAQWLSCLTVPGKI